MALMSRDQGGPSIAFQGLLYPVTDCSMSQQSYADNGEGFILETPLMQWFWDTYCPNEADRTDPRATPIHAQSFANLPSALVITAEFDPLRDEGEAYGEALKAAGSPAEIMRCDGLVHDFFSTAAVFECSRGPMLAMVERLKTHLN
jgi:acetyl esterase